MVLVSSRPSSSMAVDQQQRGGEFMSCARCSNSDWLLLLTVDGWREPAGCRNHSTSCCWNQLYLWGGDTAVMEVHISSTFSPVWRCSMWTLDCWDSAPHVDHLHWEWRAIHDQWAADSGMLPQQYSHSTLQWRMLAPLKHSEWSTNEVMQHGALHLWRYVVGGLGHAAPSSPQRGAHYQPYWVCVPMNNTFSPVILCCLSIDKWVWVLSTQPISHNERERAGNRYFLVWRL